MFFLWFWGRPGRSMGWAHMQSAHACAVEAHFFVFASFLKNRFHMTSFWFNFGTIFVINHNFEWKKSSKKWFKKRLPPWLKQRTMNKAGGSRTGSHYQELFEQETIFRTHVEAIVRVFAWKCGLGWKLTWNKKQTHDLTHPGQRPGELINQLIN